MMGTVPHISFERGTRGYPEPYLETRDQSGVYRLHKHHIMGILSTLSPTWADQANRGMITGPACTTMEHLTKTYPSWNEDEWKFNLPLVESHKRAKGWSPTTELVVCPHDRWVERVNSPEVKEFYVQFCRTPNYGKLGIVDHFKAVKGYSSVDYRMTPMEGTLKVDPGIIALHTSAPKAKQVVTELIERSNQMEAEA